MRRSPARLVPYAVAFALGLSCAFLAACGARENPGMLPATNAEELRGHLDDVLAAIDSEDCSEAREAIAQVEADLDSLPSGTSVRLLDELRDGVRALRQQSAEECRGTTTQTVPTTTTETVPTTTVETVPPTTTETVPVVPTTTTPTTTVPPETTPTTTSDTGGLEVTE